jgi:hypothetical protein
MIRAAVIVGEISATACAKTSVKFKQFGFSDVLDMTSGSVQKTTCPAPLTSEPGLKTNVWQA